MRKMSVGEMIERARLACGQEAVAMGFPEIAGYHMYSGIVADDVKGWDDETFLAWSRSMDQMFTDGSDEQVAKLQKLYGECSAILGKWGKALQETETNV